MDVARARRRTRSVRRSQRPHRNTSWDEEKFEVCAHRWADLSEPGYGVSLLNDCKYGYDTLGHVLRLTLLRGTEYPDPHGPRPYHEFTYALLPPRASGTTGRPSGKDGR